MNARDYFMMLPKIFLRGDGQDIMGCCLKGSRVSVSGGLGWEIVLMMRECHVASWSFRNLDTTDTMVISIPI